MNEQEFKTALDKVVLDGIRALGAGTVLGTLAIVTRFTEIVYDMDTMARLQNAAELTFVEESQEKGSTDDRK